MRNRRRSQRCPHCSRFPEFFCLLGSLLLAYEGLVLVILPDEKTEQALAVMQNYPEGKNAAVIGCIQEKGYALVKMKTLYGNYRIVDMLSDEQLPRI